MRDLRELRELRRSGMEYRPMKRSYALAGTAKLISEVTAGPDLDLDQTARRRFRIVLGVICEHEPVRRPPAVRADKAE